VRVCGVGASHKGSGVLGLGWRLRVTAADAGARIICAVASADADSAPRVRSFRARWLTTVCLTLPVASTSTAT
jgi:hypothetical protein